MNPELIPEMKPIKIMALFQDVSPEDFKTLKLPNYTYIDDRPDGTTSIAVQPFPIGNQIPILVLFVAMEPVKLSKGDMLINLKLLKEAGERPDATMNLEEDKTDLESNLLYCKGYHKLVDYSPGKMPGSHFLDTLKAWLIHDAMKSSPDMVTEVEYYFNFGNLPNAIVQDEIQKGPEGIAILALMALLGESKNILRM